MIGVAWLTWSDLAILYAQDQCSTAQLFFLHFCTLALHSFSLYGFYQDFSMHIMQNPQGKLFKVVQIYEIQHIQVAFFPKVLYGCQVSFWFSFIQNVVLFDTPFGSEDNIREIFICLWKIDIGENTKKLFVFRTWTWVGESHHPV